MSELTEKCVDCGRKWGEVDICCDKGTGNNNKHIEGHCINCCTEHFSQDEKTIAALRTRVAELESENTWMYGAIMEAANMGSVRCQLELKRIAQKDAGVTPKPPKPMNTHHIGTPALSRYAAAQIAKAEAEKKHKDEREGRK